MSIYDKASLVLIPSGTKTSKVYSQKPTNGDGDFTFSRSTAATRVNASGNIEKETQNLYIRSQEMDNAIWSKSRGSVTANATAAPDGTTTADLWTEDTSNGTHDIRQGTTTSSGSFYMFSIYAKANGRNVLDVYVGGANKSANFNLTTGLVTGGSAPIRKIEDVGSGWYRVSVGVLAASTTTTAIWILNNGSTQSYTGDGTSGMYFWGAQAEQSLVARNYIETTTTAIYGGITDNVPRLDYTDSSCPALLLEPQRSNLLIQSEYFNGWAQINTITTDNSINSPEGVQNAAKLVASSGYSNKVIYQGITANTYTASVFAKKGELEGLVIATGTTGAFFNLNTQSFRADYSAPVTSYKIENYGNGWFRYSITFTEAGANNLYIGPNDNVSTSLAITGDGTSGIYIYGATLEAGSYATSYIPTYGSAVTRNGESCIDTDASSIIGQTEGTLFFEFDNQPLANQARYFSLSDGGGSNRIDIYQNSLNNLGIYVATSGVAQINVTNVSVPSSGTIKFALNYANDNYVWYVNGSQVGSDTSASVPALNHTLIGAASDGAARSEKNLVRQAMLFPTRLSNQEAIDLTTI